MSDSYVSVKGNDFVFLLLMGYLCKKTRKKCWRLVSTTYCTDIKELMGAECPCFQNMKAFQINCIIPTHFNYF